ncbi:transposase [Paenibacillus dokdonensis]|uniref:Transposase n=1 Tax=Paenibacillus dokdonensis TaxID=2567944 RepID=A0ABU6GNC3_9BACL|nr:transposase [Paenibacillus dokdonensis]MEC0239756.1 transposase [Paenibacillus dokdonensis]
MRKVAKRGVGLSRIHRLKEAACRSVGNVQGKELAKMESQLLLTQYEFFQEQITELHARMDELLKEIPYSKQLLAMKGIGRDTAVGFLADIQEYLHPRQISKLAGLNLRENTSGKHKGQTRSAAGKGNGPCFSG